MAMSENQDPWVSFQISLTAVMLFKLKRETQLAVRNEKYEP